MTAPNQSSRWEKAGWIFLFIFAAADFFSISVAQIAATGLVICWIGLWVTSGEKPDLSTLKWPFAAFTVASVLSALLSIDIIESIRDSKDLLQIIIFFAAYDLFRRDIKKTGSLFKIICAAGSVIAIAGIYQVIKGGLHIHHRITGFQDIWMTYAGLIMFAIILSSALALFAFQKWRDAWILPAIGLMVAAVTLSLTRNAWLGIIVGVALLAVLRKPAAIFAIPVIAIIVFAASPPGVQQRVASIFDASDKSNRERILLWKAGVKIWSDYPMFGVGQNSFPLVYPKYRDPNVAEPEISHLHNNFLELAVERGAVGLISWMSIWLVALIVMIKGWLHRTGDSYVEMTLAASIGSVLAFLTAGFFEYNFGDSEIQMLIYLVLGAGMAAAEQALPKSNGK